MDLAARQRRGQKLFHITQARGPLDQRAHRRAVALDLGVDGDHVAGIEAEWSLPRPNHWLRSGR